MESSESRSSSKHSKRNESALGWSVPLPAPSLGPSSSEAESSDSIAFRGPDSTTTPQPLTEFLAWTLASKHARQLEDLCQSEDAADRMDEAQETYKSLKSCSKALRRLTDAELYYAMHNGLEWDTILRDDITGRTKKLDSVVDGIWGDEFRKQSESQAGSRKEIQNEGHSGEEASNEARSSEESSSEESEDEDPQEGSGERSNEGSEAGSGDDSEGSAENSDDSSSEDSEGSSDA